MPKQEASPERAFQDPDFIVSEAASNVIRGLNEEFLKEAEKIFDKPLTIAAGINVSGALLGTGGFQNATQSFEKSVKEGADLARQNLQKQAALTETMRNSVSSFDASVNNDAQNRTQFQNRQLQALSLLENYAKQITFQNIRDL